MLKCIQDLINPHPYEPLITPSFFIISLLSLKSLPFMDRVSQKQHLHQKYYLMVQESSKSLSPAKPPVLINLPHPDHSSQHASFPIIAVAIIGILATAFLLLFYYIFVIKCCLNWHRIDILLRFSLSRNRNHDHPLIRHYSPALESRGLDESVIRSIPIFQFQKQKKTDSDSVSDTKECAVCLSEFQDNEKLRMIPNCGHVFHIDCIDVWLQNNPNCPLCRTSISISIPTHFPRLDHQEIPPPTFDFTGHDEDYVVIDFGGGSGGGDRERPNSGEHATVSQSPRKLERKMGKKVRKKLGHVSSMGDECIDVSSTRKGDEQFAVQPIRRSFSMDSASDRQLYLAVQEIIQGKMMNAFDPNISSEGCSSSSSSRTIRRGFFSFGHARRAVSPLHLEQ